MHDQWQYVLACYATSMLTLGAWLWFMLRKLRRLRQAEQVTGAGLES